MAETDTLQEVVHEQVSTVSRSFHGPKESRLKRWFLFHGDRVHVTGVLLAGVLVTLLGLGTTWPIEYREMLDETTMVQTVFNTLLSGVILLVSIVVSVAAVGISQELTSLGEQTERVDTAIEYRREVERNRDLGVSPAQSGQFLAVILRSIQEQAEELEAVADEHDDPDLSADVARLTEDIRANTEELLDTLDRVESGTTDELLVGLDYDCSWQLHLTRRLLAEYDDRLSDAEQELCEDLEETLRYFLVGREYFKSLYYKREFSDLSTTLLGISLPVIILLTYILLALDSGLFPDITVLGLSPLSVFISLGYTIALAPYVVLTAYVFRAASVTKRTMAAGTFMLESEPQSPLER